jgi:hypothetical protein
MVPVSAPWQVEGGGKVSRIEFNKGSKHFSLLEITVCRIPNGLCRKIVGGRKNLDKYAQQIVVQLIPNDRQISLFVCKGAESSLDLPGRRNLIWICFSIRRQNDSRRQAAAGHGTGPT